jgi:hypothetical protein
MYAKIAAISVPAAFFTCSITTVFVANELPVIINGFEIEKSRSTSASLEREPIPYSTLP